MKKKKKLKVKKLYDGGATDTGDMGSEAANAASTAAGAASVGAGDSGPTDPGIATESITSFGDTFSANARALGPAMVVPGAGVYTALKTLADVEKGRIAMGLPPRSSKNISSTTSDSSNDNTIKPLPKLELTPEEKIPFRKMNFVRASKGSMVSTRGTKSIQVQGHKKTKLY